MGDALAGLWFWWDEHPQKRLFYHGQILAADSAFALCRFDADPNLPVGVMELVRTDEIAERCWSLFETEQAMREAVRCGTQGR